MPSHPYKFSDSWYGKVNKQIILYIFSKIYIYIYIYIVHLKMSWEIEFMLLWERECPRTAEEIQFIVQ